MRYSTAIYVVLCVTWGHCAGLATAQTQRPLSMFDLFEMQQSAETFAESSKPKTSGKAGSAPMSMFELFQSRPRGSVAAANREEKAPFSKQAVKKGLPSESSPNSEVTSLAKKTKQLQSLNSSLRSQKQTQEKEIRPRKTATIDPKQEREKPAAEALDLKAIRKFLGSDQLGSGSTSPTPANPLNSLNAGAEKQPISVPQEPTSHRSNEVDQTKIARVEPSAASAVKWEDADLKSAKCQKAKAVIEGYAFTDVQAKSCVGDKYSFSATRDMSKFSIKISPQNWELTEVAKAGPQAYIPR